MSKRPDPATVPRTVLWEDEATEDATAEGSGSPGSTASTGESTEDPEYTAAQWDEPSEAATTMAAAAAAAAEAEPFTVCDPLRKLVRYWVCWQPGCGEFNAPVSRACAGCGGERMMLKSAWANYKGEALCLTGASRDFDNETTMMRFEPDHWRCCQCAEPEPDEDAYSAGSGSDDDEEAPDRQPRLPMHYAVCPFWNEHGDGEVHERCPDCFVCNEGGERIWTGDGAEAVEVRSGLPSSLHFY